MNWNDKPDDKKSGKSGRKNPWDNNGDKASSGNDRPNQNGFPAQDDIYTMLKKAQDSFRTGGNGGGNGGSHNHDMGGANFGGFTPKRMMLLAVIGVAALWLLNGFYFVQPNEHAVVTTFGKFDSIDEQPGLKFRLPAPIQSHQIVDVTTERRIEVGYREAGRRSDIGTDVPDESLMLTGDENIIDIDFVVLWRVSNARDYLYAIRNPEDTIKIVAESAMREVIGRTPIQSALTEGRSNIQSDTRALAQKILDEYKSGVSINNIQLQKVDPPGTVIDAFNDVQRARQEKEQLRNKAEAYRNDIIPRARGESEKLRQAAEAYKAEVVSRATGDAARFKSVYAAYQPSKSVTAERMYLETMEEVMKNAQTIVLDGNKGALPYLSLNELRGKPNSVVANPTTTQAGGQ